MLQAKIKAVHAYAREGSLRGVQTALDRRKFAVSRERGGLTPLHEAVLYGRASVLRYLAARFPETLHCTDLMGRTPLHYAATLPDNGHFYNVLLTLGADKNVLDNLAKTPEHYLKNPGEISHAQLLREFEKGTRSDMDADSLDPIDPPMDNLRKSPRFITSPMRRNDTFETSLDDDPPQGFANRFVGSGRQRRPEEEDDEGEFSDKEDNDEEEEGGGGMRGRGGGGGVFANGSPDQMAGKETAFKAATRDEHGQTMLHFAATRAHGRNGMLQLLQEVDCNVALRDELYRTARDVAQQVDIQDNVVAIDRYVVSLAAKGETDKLEELLLEGYDHILDAEDENEKIVEVAAARGQRNTLAFLQSIPLFEERRDLLHRAIRAGETSRTEEIIRYHQSSGPTLAAAKNKYGRCSLHIAVLGQHQAIVNHISSRYPQTLHVGDNKGRQPSYYFMNKSEIQVLQEEEENFLEQGVEDDLDS
ncbi:hypothetical protein LSTR_LSTR014148 [Laodelphax striatellus]|uniref:Uncharacterized protein n=1 Tax=Laodelphax striatellus TaxID=195883 RepID=A0A482X475_LAOST|nr:hypothetical protein LSTR_LSTR014148 [Laodelphax striatellus]